MMRILSTATTYHNLIFPALAKTGFSLAPKWQTRDENFVAKISSQRANL